MDLYPVYNSAALTCKACGKEHQAAYADRADGLYVCSDCAEGKPPLLYVVENVVFVSPEDHRDVVVFVDGFEYRISQRSIANHKKLVGIVTALKVFIDSGNSVISRGSYLDKTIEHLLAGEERVEA